MRPGVPDIRFSDAADAQVAEYRPLAGQAVAALLFAIVAPLAFFDPLAWTLPVLSITFGIWALRRIRKQDGALSGRGLALISLIVSLLLAFAAPTDWLVYRWKMRGEAREFSTQWFRCIAQEEPQTAFQLTLPPQLRAPKDQALWSFYRNSPRLRQQLESYVKGPLIRTLLALGPKSQVRFYQTASQSGGLDDHAVEQWYAITYEEDGEKKSFLVALQMERTILADGSAAWQIAATHLATPAPASKG